MRVKAVAAPVSEAENTKSVRVKATVTVLLTVEGYFSELGINRGIDDILEFLGKSLQLELVSAELDSSEYSLLLANKNLSKRLHLFAVIFIIIIIKVHTIRLNQLGLGFCLNLKINKRLNQ